MLFTVTFPAKVLVALTVSVSELASPIVVLPLNVAAPDTVNAPVTEALFRVAKPEVVNVLKVVAPVTPKVVVTEALFNVARAEVLKVPVIAVLPAFTPARVDNPETFNVVPEVIPCVVVTDLNVTSEVV